MNRISTLRILSNHDCASRDAGFACSPRQICPPAAGLSSTTATRAPFCAARKAAAIPAGPAPTTSTSQTSAIGPHVHPFAANCLTTATVLLLVNRHTTLETNPHTTQWPTWLTTRGATKCIYACFQNCRRNHTARGHRHGNAADHDSHRIRHALAPVSHARAGKAPLGSPFFGSLSVRREVSQCREIGRATV